MPIEPQLQPEFEYDVAISFLAPDEGLAIRLADLLRDRMKVFVYSEQQKEVAGRDGLEVFSSVFGERARVCVVLFREGWGGTKWTRIEETALKTRAFEKGWDFLFVVALTSAGAPAWLPKTRIWASYERFGLEGAAIASNPLLDSWAARPRKKRRAWRTFEVASHAPTRRTHAGRVSLAPVTEDTSLPVVLGPAPARAA